MSSSIEIDTKSYFYFKKFTVKQDQCPLRVSTDAVLLGAWAKFPTAKKILDIGTGTGVIALMLAQRYEAYIKGIDINPASVNQSMDNFKNNLWANRMHSRHISVQELSYTGQKYDGIVCNPPYFTKSLLSDDCLKNQARHSDLVLPIEDLFSSSARLLNISGSLAIILPADYAEKAILTAEIHSFHLYRSLWVKTLAEKPPKRVLLQFGFKTIKPKSEKEILIGQNAEGIYFPEYEKLISPYFLTKEERQLMFKPEQKTN